MRFFGLLKDPILGALVFLERGTPLGVFAALNPGTLVKSVINKCPKELLKGDPFFTLKFHFNGPQKHVSTGLVRPIM